MGRELTRAAALLAWSLALFTGAATAEPRAPSEAEPQDVEAPPPPPSDLPPDLTVDESPSRFARVSPWAERPVAAELHGSLGGPLGVIGVAFDLTPRRDFAWMIGAGYEARTASARLATLIRLRLPITSHFATGSEGGLAYGKHDDGVTCGEPPCHPSFRWEHAAFGYVGLLLEGRTRSGFVYRWSFGAGAILNVVDFECARCSPSAEPSLWVTTLPYTTVALGYALPW